MFVVVFIAEKGPECFSDKKDAIMHCANKTFHGYIPSETPTIDSLPNLILGEKECDDMDLLQQCVVAELESCEESTPANLVESLFKFIKNETPCVNYTSKLVPGAHQRGKIQPNGASDLNKLSINVLIGTWLMALVAKVLISH